MSIRGLDTPILLRETAGILHRVSQEGGYAFVRMALRAEAAREMAEAAREMAWEQLNWGPWHTVLPIWKDAYAMACIHVAKHHFAAGEFRDALRVLETGLSMGGGLLRVDLEAAVERVMVVQGLQNGG